MTKTQLILTLVARYPRITHNQLARLVIKAGFKSSSVQWRLFWLVRLKRLHLIGGKYYLLENPRKGLPDTPVFEWPEQLIGFAPE